MAKITARDSLKERVLSVYPTPLAFLYKKLIENPDLTGKDLLEIFDFILAFLGSIALADYFKQGATSEKQNLRIVSSIRSMNSEKWFDTLCGLIPIISGGSVPELIDVYREFKKDQNRLPNYFQSFRNRMRIEYIPPDREEIMGIKFRILKLFEILGFLSGYSLIGCAEKEAFLLKGTGERRTVSIPKESKPGDVILISPDKRRYLPLSPFVFYSTEPVGIRFSDFNKDKDIYQQLMRNPIVSKVVKKCQSIISGNPDFSTIEEQFPPGSPFSGMKEKLTIALAEKCQRILVEGYPGSGKTMFISKLEEFVDPQQYQVIKYYLEEGHILTSTTFFTRFLYLKINSFLDKPHQPELKGVGWQNFKKMVMSDFGRTPKKVILALDSINYAMKPILGEKICIDDYLQMTLPPNLFLVMTTRPGEYPRRFHRRIKLDPINDGDLQKMTNGNRIDAETAALLCNFYGGCAGYLFDVIQNDNIQAQRFPDIIWEKFTQLLFQYDFYEPVREKIIRFLANQEEYVSIQQISEEIGVFTPEALFHLSKIQPILRIRNEGNQTLYRLFIPAFSHFIGNLAK